MTTDTGNTEERLRDAFDALATEIRPDPSSCRRVIAGWRRRQRKRRLIIAILLAVIFTAADAIGLWALNQADPGTHIIFSDPSTGQDHPTGHLDRP
ncbi:MAG: hypothetical protein ACRDRA_14225 [Pseudonocardiaceae bacterium]